MKQIYGTYNMWIKGKRNNVFNESTDDNYISFRNKYLDLIDIETNNTFITLSYFGKTLIFYLNGLLKLQLEHIISLCDYQLSINFENS